MTEELNRKIIFDQVRAFQPLCVMIAGAELDVFTILHAKPMNAAQLARRIKGDLRATTILLDALTAIGLLNKATHREPVYRVPPAVAEVLTETGSQSMLGMVRHQGNCLRNWAQLAGVVLRGKPATGAFIQDWLVCGPFTKPGLAGAPAFFDVAFGPEKQGEKVQWKAMPRGDQPNLASLFPGVDNAAAYLKATIITPENCNAALLLGSDDGIKVWLNGAVVFGANTDRGDMPDQDMAPIELKKGANELMLKITQGGGGWSACARIVAPDGAPIPGLATDVNINRAAEKPAP